ncbi:hypothetical protein BGY98DRAFT_1032583 [Russula aff. rugulosa BPL654]|nr:hypothetical protein BGY98DRAFT_1032583 [Russula aff. rugulosa BPL654]
MGIGYDNKQNAQPERALFSCCCANTTWKAILDPWPLLGCCRCGRNPDSILLLV